MGNSIEDYVDLWQRLNTLRSKCYVMIDRNGNDAYERKAMQAVYDALNQSAKWALELAQHIETAHE